MSRIHYFQRYSQPENVITNNALLFLGRIYELGPVHFEKVLRGLFEDAMGDMAVGISMAQQKPAKSGGVPDGLIEQDSFKIVVETKQSKAFDVAQLNRHAASFQNESTRILMLLSPEALSATELGKLKGRCTLPAGVDLVSASFEDLIESAKAANTREDAVFEDLIDDYETYCINDGLLPVSKYLMRAITAGKTFQQNLDYRLYYDDASRGFSDHAYLGLYNRKAVRAIGRVIDRITADLVGGKLVNVASEIMGTPDPAHLDLISKVIPAAQLDPGYNVSSGHRFFIVDEFVPTEFIKDSKNAIMRTKFFDLRDYLYLPEKGEMPAVKEIAGQLKGKGWKKDKREMN